MIKERTVLQTLKKSVLLAMSFMMALSIGLISNIYQTDAASTYLARNNGVTYTFTKNVHSPAFHSSKSGYFKLSYRSSCASNSGKWIVRLQKKISGQWTVVKVTEPVVCRTSQKSGVLVFGYEQPGTYRIEFYKLSGSSQVRVHDWGVYRSTNP